MKPACLADCLEETACCNCGDHIAEGDYREMDAQGAWCTACVANNLHVEAVDPWKRIKAMSDLAAYLFGAGKTGPAIVLMTKVVEMYGSINRPGSDAHVARRALAQMQDRARREAARGNSAA